MSKIIQSRSWILTLPQDEYSQDCVAKKLKNYTYTGQLEKASTGYLHWQIYIENKGAIKFDTLRNKFPKGHYEVRQGTRRQAMEYVSKEETFQGVKISNGEINIEADDEGSTKLTQIRDAIVHEGRTLNDIVLSENADVVSKNLRYLEKTAEASDEFRFSNVEREVEVEYIWGKSGIGKTSGIYRQHGYKNVYRVNDYDHPFDAYERQEVLVLDEYYSQIKFSLMLNILDRYPLRLPARYRDRWAAFTKVYIVSNVDLSDQYRNIQNTNPEGWNALMRRIKVVKEQTGIDQFLDLSDISYSM